MNVEIAVLAALAVILLALAAFLFTKWWAAKSKLERYSGITDVETRQAELQRAAMSMEAAHAHNVDSTQRGIAALQAQFAAETARLAQLRHEIGDVEEAADLQSFGLYKPLYDLESSEEYVDRLKRNREHQKSLIKADPFNLGVRGAAKCPNAWTVDGSEEKGKKMVREQIKLMIRAFNGECDAAISKVKYNNVLKVEQRISRSFNALNKLGKSKTIELTSDLLNAKLEELRLVHELAEQRQQEKEEQQRIREEMREEQRAAKEIEKAESDAERDEAKSAAQLEKARADLASATGRQLSKLEKLVAKLETELSAAIDRKAKAIARAQLTRSGHVYVLSNVGSFGEGVYKIGMTRRLEPLDRVNELGDASVPFRFDVHAMIYAEDAPDLERALHQHFNHQRVNKVNLRREYFRVTLAEIRQAVAKHHGVVTFVLEPAAEEYRKTRAMEDEARIANAS